MSSVSYFLSFEREALLERHCEVSEVADVALVASLSQSQQPRVHECYDFLWDGRFLYHGHQRTRVDNLASVYITRVCPCPIEQSGKGRHFHYPGQHKADQIASSENRRSSRRFARKTRAPSASNAEVKV
jgi:hypothetical protein